MLYCITPCPKPRMTQSDKWKKRPCVMRYRAFKDKCRALSVTLPERCMIIFRIPMPKSWPMAKAAEMNGEPHRAKPDLDNLIKALADALFEEDSHLWSFQAEKRWSNVGGIEIVALK